MYNDLLKIKYEYGVMDCAILAQEVFHRYGMDVPVPDTARRALEIAETLSEESEVMLNTINSMWTPISSPVEPCLVVVTSFGWCHVGVYIGNNMFIHTSRLRKYPTIESLDNPLYAKRKFYTYNGN